MMDFEQFMLRVFAFSRGMYGPGDQQGPAMDTISDAFDRLVDAYDPETERVDPETFVDGMTDIALAALTGIMRAGVYSYGQRQPQAAELVSHQLVFTQNLIETCDDDEDDTDPDLPVATDGGGQNVH